MNDNLTLAVAQEKLKCEIAAGRDRTLTALIFARTGHVIRLVIRAQKPISWVYSAIGLNLVLVLGATLLLAMTRWGGGLLAIAD